MEDQFIQQLKKGVLEMLVLETICADSTYGYELLAKLKEGSAGLLALKEGTIYPILYRLENAGMIQSRWEQGEGRSTPKKIYYSTEKGKMECRRRWQVWATFSNVVNSFNKEGIVSDG